MAEKRICQSTQLCTIQNLKDINKECHFKHGIAVSTSIATTWYDSEPERQKQRMSL